VVDSIVRQHEGWIDLESAEGRGTTFHVFLPVSTARPGAAGVRARDEPVQGGTEHVLVVDDDIQLRVLLERVLSGAGYRVSTAENGEAALKMLETQQMREQREAKRGQDVTLVVSDLVMPKLDGEGLRAALAERHPSIRTVFMTGYARDAGRSEAGRSEAGRGEAGRSEAGRDAYPHLLIKPFSPRQLLETVRAVLDA
jgi:two-component system, cell cycle sensor histidine kinase and response regulator CckA